jgi:hypothetical protein
MTLEAEKLMEMCFQLLAFGVIQFFISRKLIKKYQKAGNKHPLNYLPFFALASLVAAYFSCFVCILTSHKFLSPLR